MQQIVKKLRQQWVEKVENNMLISTIILSLAALYIVLEQYQLFKYNNMEKNINWHQITYQSNENNQIPCKRWGHKTIHIEDQIVLFGGFSDVTYLNDLWGYNVYTNKWRQIETFGKKPEGKSNFTMHYDSVTMQLLVFGGGGPNKRKFNKVSILNWQTKQWTQHQPLQLNNSMQHLAQQQSMMNQSANNTPWQRTYHSSQFKYPYLITFGGEATGNIDLDDLWMFDVVKRMWMEIRTIGEDGSVGGIEGRKFHSTAMIDNKFYVIAGCRTNYTCIPNIYSIDLSQLYKSTKYDNSKRTLQQEAKQYQYSQTHNLGNNINSLNAQFEKQSIQGEQGQGLIGKMFVWKKHLLKEKEVELIQKWGHSSQNYNGKIYLFGGRNQQDFNDIIQYDPKSQTLVKLLPQCSNTNKLPKSRRRHSSCMLGCSMIIFGGFNLQYFNDLQYISLFHCKDTLKQQNYSLQIGGTELIELQQEIFHHFMQQISKDKPQYDIELWVQSLKHKQPVIVKSVAGMLRKKSEYFENCFKYNSESNNNPEHKTLAVTLKSLPVSMMAFQIFNTFIIKDLLILPKQCNIKKLSQLLHCAQYFLIPTLTQLIENILTLRVINRQSQSIEDIFNIAANFNLEKLMKCCAEKKVIDYNKNCDNNNRVGISLGNQRAKKLKSRHIEDVLEEVRFERIQFGEKIITKGNHTFFNNNLYEDNLLAGGQQEGKPRKKSLVQKFVQSLTKKFRISTPTATTPSTQQSRLSQRQQQEQLQQQQQVYFSDEDDDYEDGILNNNEVKMEL